MSNIKEERVFTDQTSNKMPCGTYVAALTISPSKAPHPSEGQRTEHQRAQWGADVRQGVPDADTVHTEESDLPEGLSRGRIGPLDKNIGRGDE